MTAPAAIGWAGRSGSATDLPLGCRDVTIIGSGVVGLAMGLALSRAGLSVTLAEQAAADAVHAGGDRAYILTGPSRALLCDLGVWDDLKPHAVPVHHIHVGESAARAACPDVAVRFQQDRPKDGPLAHILTERHLRAVLTQRIQREKAVQLCHGLSLRKLARAGGQMRATFANGAVAGSALVIGCDGGRSPTADLAGIAQDRVLFDQTALVMTVRHRAPRRHGTAYACLLPGGPLSVLPLGPDRASIMWADRKESAAALRALPEHAFRARLNEMLAPILGPVEPVGAVTQFPLSASCARRFIAPGVALVGDAAHVFHPVTGQGLNYGLRDVAALTRILVAARRAGTSLSDASVLRRYDRARRGDARLMARTTNAILTLFGSEAPLVPGLRSHGLTALAALPMLRRYLVRRASGPRMELAGLIPDGPTLSDPVNP
ncbi:2-octaprenyl-6-methoxyphenol hydroxylase [Rubricella aquisinus]|uniref:2-octaprenyl-6-methoxyphenol hydroxylase n=1 Tax=Rubricella aquisinus TaxID=2028108 RepID=A0A840X0S6_9RHOB|nr:FAD-dependent monooxygenase [Rubricella aquisinus]MBB5514267.1 2-octaprenyl-6-methoxyphenol hydroxylase [Rubricella aquisinus]